MCLRGGGGSNGDNYPGCIVLDCFEWRHGH